MSVNNWCSTYVIMYSVQENPQKILGRMRNGRYQSISTVVDEVLSYEVQELCPTTYLVVEKVNLLLRYVSLKVANNVKIETMIPKWKQTIEFIKTKIVFEKQG